ncbi:capsular biosynthesis protein [Burkholderia cepacia]|uniref:sulfotransferase family 2 domain-containing protein n=1 Tax=Burkholderia cepacia complex TaxID=87882 RepID=UPI00075BFA45|nr:MULTISPECIES: sulfotransferase family 2 domain-containing protein [Burkholderia cepacia complex]KVA35636.1 capsular biosynthesis protein [Burkholderia cepacia]KVA36261.1 capsular biosynthesis protein [Burkholderia cepacia]KVE80100.1 capsular biosynthesis protein [Burkholderia cepacia]KVH75313.1 capsular biosynthesis protein [Burkholderia cepacia]KVQ33285.1 capsular biosynthesis protein [Burkholderia cepacia]
MRERTVDYSFRGMARSRERLSGQIVFHHIPKTAGSSFNQILRTLYRDDEVCNAALDCELDEAMADEARRYGLFVGHFSFDALRRHFGDATRLTFLRDPVQRCISQYHNWHDSSRYADAWVGRNETKPDVIDALKMASEMSLCEFVSSDNLVISDSAQNMMTRYLAPRAEWKKERGYYDAALVAEAKRNLVEYFHFFGLTEQFDRSLLILAHTLGIRPWERSETLLTNRNPKKTSFSSGYNTTVEEAGILRDYNLMDIELYEFAVKEFNRRFDMSYQRLVECAFEYLADKDTRDIGNAGDFHVFDMKTAAGARGLHFLESTRLPCGTDVLGRWTGLEPRVVWEIPLRAGRDSHVVIEVDYIDSVSHEALTPGHFTLNDMSAVQYAFGTEGSVQRLRLVFPVGGTFAGRMLHTMKLATPLVRAEDGTRDVGVFLLRLQSYSV